MANTYGLLPIHKVILVAARCKMDMHYYGKVQVHGVTMFCVWVLAASTAVRDSLPSTVYN